MAKVVALCKQAQLSFLLIKDLFFVELGCLLVPLWKAVCACRCAHVWFFWGDERGRLISFCFESVSVL